jgi:ribosomal protein S18 acetylase RimI-like enzyme
MRPAGAALHRVISAGRVYLVVFDHGRGELHVHGEQAYIVDLFVEPAYRSQGLGAQYIAELLTIASKKGVCRVVAHVAEDNVPSLKAFERIGFTPKDHERHMEYRFAGCAGGQS